MCTKWKIAINPEKSHVPLITGRTRIKTSGKIVIDGKLLSWNGQVKYLAVTIHNGLTFNIHVNMTQQKIKEAQAKLYSLTGRKSK